MSDKPLSPDASVVSAAEGSAGISVSACAQRTAAVFADARRAQKRVKEMRCCFI
jgi:hypothetical protein